MADNLSFTVVGYHEGNGRTFAVVIDAASAGEAIVEVARRKYGGDAMIVGAVRGSLQMIAPCDSGSVASVNDLMGS